MKDRFKENKQSIGRDYTVSNSLSYSNGLPPCNIFGIVFLISMFLITVHIIHVNPNDSIVLKVLIIQFSTIIIFLGVFLLCDEKKGQPLLNALKDILKSWR
ncbi:hypothetical protein [Clostridium perfringens]|uniref:hypothetical protein n=1 Tax=Clostridium perfringens TaxID=1502 RepID=UPI0018E460D1|nr:hypothetical protein [Clostridium perfringens]MBI5998565.1 hypothetical protein [Clostridium perfringens]